MKKWACILFYFFFLQSFAQYSYTYTDPCTLQLKSVFVPAGGGVVVNYFNNQNTFNSNDFSSGAFDNWIALVSQQNSNSPCQSVTTAIVNSITNVTVANTLTVVTNVISVTNVAQSIATIGGSMGSSMTATAGGVTNSSQSEGGSTNQNSKDEKKSDSNTPTGTNSGTTGTGSTGNQSQGGQTNPSSSGGTPSQPSSGTPQQGGETTSPNQPTSTGGSTSESSVEGSSGGGSNLANSLSNSVDGGSADGGSSSGGGGTSGGGKKSNTAAKSVGSLIASGDIVAIANTDQTQNFRFVGSITHANTRGTRIKGVLFNFTSGVNNLNVTFYKSWINKSKKLNTVGAQSLMMDFDKNFFSTTTVLESYKVSSKLTGMFGVNFTAGKMGERALLNLSAVAGGHSSFKLSDRVSTSVLVLGVYSPFTQFYEGKWWDAGIIIVPFNSWDLKITKTFKFNVSFTGVYEAGKEFLNYQILTGGKLTF
jgi:hypothetical protein